MKTKLTALLSILLFWGGCSTVPITGRKQLSLVSNSEVLSLSSQSFSEYMKTAIPSTSKTDTELVVKVGKKIANAVENFLRSQGRSTDIKDFAWEFHLVKDPSPNAFCMPGGKIVVNEGILPYTKTEAGLAVVLGHEVAHAVAKHSSERISRQLLIEGGGVALGVLMNEKPAVTQQIAQQVYGLGANYGVVLPYSRSNESEADRLGLIFIAMAGYNPNEAIGFWERMAAASTQSVPQFMSTHPSDQKRIKDIKALIPEAMQYYK